MYIESFTASQANHSWPCISFQQVSASECVTEFDLNQCFVRFLNKLFQLASSYTASFSQCIHIAMDASDVQFKRTDLTLNQTICCIDLHGNQKPFKKGLKSHHKLNQPTPYSFFVGLECSSNQLKLL
uniref:Uncharacterized protein n=1 Tax=Glossina palpalis gambiensis TaxID=67801 RepID=A0A1B0BMI6_9MUSC